MKSLLTRLLALALVLVFSVPVSLHAQLIEGRVVAPTLNVRSGPTSHAENVIGQLSVDALVSIEGRNPAGDWFYIRAEGSGLAGWAASGFIAYIQDQYSAIPVLTEAPPAVAVASGGTISTGSADLIMQTPIFSNFTTSSSSSCRSIKCIQEYSKLGRLTMKMTKHMHHLRTRWCLTVDYTPPPSLSAAATPLGCSLRSSIANDVSVTGTGRQRLAWCSCPVVAVDGKKSTVGRVMVGERACRGIPSMC